MRGGSFITLYRRQLLAFGRQQVLQPKVVDLTEIVGGMGKMLKRLIGADVELNVGGAVADAGGSRRASSAKRSARPTGFAK